MSNPDGIDLHFDDALTLAFVGDDNPDLFRGRLLALMRSYSEMVIMAKERPGRIAMELTFDNSTACPAVKSKVIFHKTSQDRPQSEL